MIKSVKIITHTQYDFYSNVENEKFRETINVQTCAAMCRYINDVYCTCNDLSMSMSKFEILEVEKDSCTKRKKREKCIRGD